MSANISIIWFVKLPWWHSIKESAYNTGDTGSYPGSGRSPGGGHGHPLQSSCLENPMDRGAWATIHGVADSDMAEATEHTCTKQL